MHQYTTSTRNLLTPQTLREKGMSLTEPECVTLALQIARGEEYLVSQASH